MGAIIQSKYHINGKLLILLLQLGVYEVHEVPEVRLPLDGAGEQS